MQYIELISTLTISLALFFYSFGIWAERIARYLRKWHLVFFWLGFIFDITGTLGMHIMSEGPFSLKNPHTLTGQIALWLMLAHAIWASVVVSRNLEKMKKVFHRYSLVVWLIWLIPYFGGMIMAMK